MAFKTFQIEPLGAVTVYKRRGARSMRLTIRSDNSLRVTIPSWLTYDAGVRFAKSRVDWVQRHARPPAELLEHNQPIGKAHHLVFVADRAAAKASSRLAGSDIRVTYPADWSATDARVQTIAKRAAIRALRRQAEQLLPDRLNTLSQRFNLPFRSVSIKQLQTRWGSCDQSKNIALNLFLMQLPWELIDYVLLHELTHTIVMAHGPRFWQTMEQYEPQTAARRQAIKQYRTAIG